MEVHEIMNTKVVEIPKDLTLKEAAKVLIDNKISGAPVVDEHKNLVGIISEKDLFKSLYPDYTKYYTDQNLRADHNKIEEAIVAASKTKIENVMSTEVITVEPDDSVLRVGAIMMAKGIHRVVVIKNNEILGIVSRRDVYSRVFEKVLDID